MLNIACMCFQFYSNKFKVEQPLKKLDLIPVENFSVLGMENWGNKFRKSYLLTFL